MTHLQPTHTLIGMLSILAARRRMNQELRASTVSTITEPGLESSPQACLGHMAKGQKSQPGLKWSSWIKGQRSSGRPIPPWSWSSPLTLTGALKALHTVILNLFSLCFSYSCSCINSCCPLSQSSLLIYHLPTEIV